MATTSLQSRALPALALVPLLIFLACTLHYSSTGGSSFVATIKTRNHTALSNHTSSSISLPPLDNILFVNIRKSGGSEIKSGFRCFKKRKKLSSTLANKITSCIHTQNDTKPKGTIPTVDAYLYNVRHPIDRLLSWYLYERPSSCISKETTRKACQAAQEVAKHPHGYASQFFVNCFPSQEYLSYAFTNRISKQCNKLFARLINNELVLPGAGFRETPFKYDLRYATNKTINQYPNKTVLVVRSQVIFEDLHDLEVLMGGNGIFPRKETYHDGVSSDELQRYYGPLCWKGAMRKELYEYRRLIQLAANFNPATKQATIDEAANRCGFSSWKEMEETMMKKQQQQDEDGT